ncbi:50S ribosomal protein L10 [Candidatus Gracilibacteria bacterium]|nr:50S ribosomal protein L10 [Candidatus Gracilibacteria bacterium]
MAITKVKKTEQLSSLESKFNEAKGVAFLKFDGLTVEEAQIMRRELRANGMSYTVIKKTLIELAAKNAGFKDVDSKALEGAVAVIVSPHDEVAPAALIKKYQKEFINVATKKSKLDFAGGVFGGVFIDAAATKELSTVPSREESLGKIVGVLRSGPQKLHGVLNSGFQKLFNVLQNAEKFAS